MRLAEFDVAPNQLKTAPIKPRLPARKPSSCTMEAAGVERVA